MKNYCLLLGLEIRYRERALTAAAKLTDMPIAILQPDAPINSNVYADIVISGDSARDDALSAVLDYEKHTGWRPGAVIPLGEPTITPGLMIAKYYQRPYLSQKTVTTVRNKLSMLNAFKQSGLAIPRYMKIDNKDEFEGAIEQLNFPLIVKPSNLYSSIGVKFAPNKKALDGVFDTCACLAKAQGTKNRPSR